MSDQKFYEKKDFKALQKEWYQKLKEEGFRDIEDQKTGIVERPFSHRRYRTDLFYQASVDYYLTMGHYLENGHIRSDLDRKVLEMHIEGRTYRAIAKELNQHTNTVYRKVQRYKKKAFARKKDE